MFIFHPPGRTVFALIQDSQYDLSILSQELNQGQKVRIIVEGQAGLAELKTRALALQQDIPNLSVVDYQTIFYTHDIQDILDFHTTHPETNWQQYKNNFETLQIDNLEDSNYHILENYIVNSNGVNFGVDATGQTIITADIPRQNKIKETLKSTMNQANNIGFVIRKKSDTSQYSYAGAYILTLVGHYIYWQYVSGKAHGIEQIKEKKMPYITASMFDTWSTKYSEYQQLFFSNSDHKTKAVYQNLGFRPDTNRHCIILKKNLSDVDLR